MLRFSSQQTDQMTKMREKSWVASLAQDFREQFARLAQAPLPELTRRLAADFEQLRDFGIVAEPLLRRMLEWTVLIGPSFWSQPGYRARFVIG